MAHLRWLASYREGLAFAIVVVAITYVSLVLGELLPKRLALYNPERIAYGTAGLMDFISRLCSPIVALISGSTRLVISILRLRPAEAPPVTEEEIKVMMEQGTEAGGFEEGGHEIVKNNFKIGERAVRAFAG